jgi:hypothetical protein
MAIPPGSLSLSLDVRNTDCFINSTTAVNDLSGNGKNFTLTTSSVSYDSNVGSISIPNAEQAAGDPADFAYGTSALTVVYWAKLNTAYAQPYDLWLGPVAGAAGSIYSIVRDTSSNIIQLITYSSPDTSFKRFSLVHDGKWHLLAFTRPVNATMNDVKFYLDGVEQSPIASDALTQVFNTSGTGRANISSTLGNNGLTFGTFDIYTAQLSSSDILDLYKTQLVRYATLERLYDMSNPACYSGTGLTVINAAQAAYYPKLVNSPTFAGSGQSKYFEFNGTNQYLGNLESGGPQSSIGGPYSVFTMIAWFQSNNNNRGTIASFGKRATPDNAPSILTNDANFVQSNGISTGSLRTTVGDAQTTTVISPGEWQMVAYTADGTNTKIYLNGVLQDTGTQSGAEWPQYGSSLFAANVGAYGVVQGPYFDGKIAYFAQYKDIALPEESILTFYNETYDRFHPPATNLICKLDFADPACFTDGGTAVNDLSGNDNNWTLDSTSYTFNAANGSLTLAPTTNLVADSLLFQGAYPFFTGDTNISFSFWFYYDETTEVNPFLNMISGGELTFETLSDGYVRTTVYPNYVDTLSQVVIDQQYNNFMFIYNGSQWQLFVNNILVSNFAQSVIQGPAYPQMYFNNPDLNIGLEGLGLFYFYAGEIDSTTRTDLYNEGVNRFNVPLPPVTGLSNGRRFGQGFPQ